MARVFFDFLGPPPNWWGGTVLAVGTLSAVLGVLYALMEHDLKRLLAYHSIETIGIILMGLGAALMFLHTNNPVLATLALIAGLYHTINHAIFKALLFLGAGAVLHATHTRNMEEMGGLIKRMPKTAFCFLVGAVAISALTSMLDGVVEAAGVIKAASPETLVIVGGPHATVEPQSTAAASSVLFSGGVG